MASGTVMAIAAVVSAAGAVYGGIQAKKSADFNAAVARRNAEQERLNALENARRQDRDNRKTMGAIRARGGSIDLLEDNAMEAEIERLSILFGGDLRSTGLEESADISESEGKQRLIAGIGQGASTALGAYGAYNSGAAKIKPAPKGWHEIR